MPPPEIIESNQRTIDADRIPDRVYAGHLLGVGPFAFVQEVLEPVIAYLLNLILRVDRRAMAVSCCLVVCSLGSVLHDRPLARAAVSCIPALVLGLPVAAFPVGHSAGPRMSHLCKVAGVASICAIVLLFYAFVGAFGESFVDTI